MTFHIKKVRTNKDLKTYIYLPEKLHSNSPNWTPPLYMDEHHKYNRGKNLSYRYSDAILGLAFRGNKAVGRIMGIINNRYNELCGARIARFSELEAEEDPLLVRALLSYVETWARQKGMTQIIGPFGFGIQDPQGLLIKGFEYPGNIAAVYNQPWMPEMVAKAGYRKQIDSMTYHIAIPRDLPDIIKKAGHRIMKRNKLRSIAIRSRKGIFQWLRPFVSLMNETYFNAGIYGYAPLDQAEIDDLVKKYFWFLNPKLLKGVVNEENRLVACFIAMPDMSEGLRASGGRLLPSGWLKMFLTTQRTRQLNFLIGAVHEDYRGLGVESLMVLDMARSAREMGFELVDTHSVLEDNIRMRRLFERYGKVVKKHRIYQKPL